MGIYRHYGADTFDKGWSYGSRENPVNFKPRGLWAGPVNPETNSTSWHDWCEDSEWNLEGLTQHFDFVLSDDARILQIHTPADILPYTKPDPHAMYMSIARIPDPTAKVLIDHEKLRKDFDGMEVYFEENYNDFWWSRLFYGYDVNSLVVWNLDKVIVIDADGGANNED